MFRQLARAISPYITFVYIDVWLKSFFRPCARVSSSLISTWYCGRYFLFLFSGIPIIMNPRSTSDQKCLVPPDAYRIRLQLVDRRRLVFHRVNRTKIEELAVFHVFLSACLPHPICSEMALPTGGRFRVVEKTCWHGFRQYTSYASSSCLRRTVARRGSHLFCVDNIGWPKVVVGFVRRSVVLPKNIPRPIQIRTFRCVMQRPTGFFCRLMTFAARNLEGAVRVAGVSRKAARLCRTVVGFRYGRPSGERS